MVDIGSCAVEAQAKTALRMIQPTPFPHGRGLCSKALLTAHGRWLNRFYAFLGPSMRQLSRCNRAGQGTEPF